MKQLQQRFWLSVMDLLNMCNCACRRRRWHSLDEAFFALYLVAVERASDCTDWRQS